MKPRAVRLHRLPRDRDASQRATYGWLSRLATIGGGYLLSRLRRPSSSPRRTAARRLFTLSLA